MSEVVIRADASLEIGTGHVMRCLSLAEALRRAGHDVRFVTRALPGHLGSRIDAAGFETVLLPAADRRYVPAPGAPAHAAWAGVDWEEDARAVVAALEGRRAEWLVLDHYAFDARWEQAVAGQVNRVLVMDDLADRTHACDLLLDQNLGRSPTSYAGLVPDGTRVLAGPDYAILRPEFAALRDKTLAARKGRGLRRIMISMGGVDRPNATGAILEVLASVPGLDGLALEVILGSTAPAVEAVREQAAAMPMTVEVAVDVTDMAQRMARADLAIGAVGGTAWERCALGLPSLLLTIADNQLAAAQVLHAAGSGILLGSVDDTDWPKRLHAFLSNEDLPRRLNFMSEVAASLCDGGGAARVSAAMCEIARRAA